jgi:hypothetical protein
MDQFVVFDIKTNNRLKRFQFDFAFFELFWKYYYSDIKIKFHGLFVNVNFFEIEHDE